MMMNVSEIMMMILYKAVVVVVVVVTKVAVNNVNMITNVNTVIHAIIVVISPVTSCRTVVVAVSKTVLPQGYNNNCNNQLVS